VKGYCSCAAPDRRVVEGVLTCGACGESIADPLLVRLLAEVMAQRRQLAELEQRLTEPKPRTPDWLAPKEFALLLGRSVDFVYRHSDELGAVRIGDGPRPRLLFPAHQFSSGDFPLDSAERPPVSRQVEEPPISHGR
jgi:hypothetical protein